MFRPIMAIVRFLYRLREVYISIYLFNWLCCLTTLSSLSLTKSNVSGNKYIKPLIINLKFSDFLCCFHLFFDLCRDRGSVSIHCFYAELGGAFYISQMENLCGVLGSGRPSVTYYQQPNTLSDFHKISYKRLLQKFVKPD